MSIKRVTSIWDKSTHSGTALLVLLALADNADDNGLAWPSIPTLAQRARCGERAVKTHIQTLERSGELRTFRRKGRHNFYIVTVGLDQTQIDSAVARLNGILKTSDPAITGDPAITTTSDRQITTTSDRQITTTSDRQITTTSDLGITRSVIRTVNESDPSCDPSDFSPPGGGESAAVVQSAQESPGPEKPKRARRRKDGTDPVPSALMTPMKNAIAAAFGWSWEGDTPMSEDEVGLIQKAARSLCKAKYAPEGIPALYAFCQRKYDTFGPMALATNVSKFRQSGGKHNGLGSHHSPARGSGVTGAAGGTPPPPIPEERKRFIAEQNERRRKELAAKGFKVPGYTPGTS